MKKKIINEWENLNPKLQEIVVIIGQYNYLKITHSEFWERIHKILKRELFLFYEEMFKHYLPRPPLLMKKESSPLWKLVRKQTKKELGT